MHHGYFWKGEDPRIIGIKRRRLQALWQAEMSLLAYHLPLDVHTKWGNNVQLAKRLDWMLSKQVRVDGVPGLLCSGSLPELSSIVTLTEKLTNSLGQVPLVIAPEDWDQEKACIDRIAWCTGAAQRYFQKAIDLGAQAFFTGEISESTVHLAREAGACFFACGHHATEKYGVQAVGHALKETFGIEVQFFDEENPV